jgi:hypothetical protein
LTFSTNTKAVVEVFETDFDDAVFNLPQHVKCPRGNVNQFSVQDIFAAGV